VTRYGRRQLIIDSLSLKQAESRLAISRHACVLFWESGVSATSGDDIAARAGLSTRTIWRHFRSKESCVEPVLAQSAHRFIEILGRWPAQLSLAEHLAADVIEHPLTQQDIHDELERGFIPVIAQRLGLTDDDLTVRLCAAAVTGAFRVVDEDVSRAIVVDHRAVTQSEALALIDRAIRDATNGRLGGLMTA